VGLFIPDRSAVILLLPSATLVAKPTEEMVATVVSELAQVTWEVISAVELSVYVPIALNCRVEPTVKLVREAGVIVMEDNDITVKATGRLLRLPMTAVILAIPGATPAAKPVVEIVAVPVLSLVQITCEVMSAVVPSEWVPVAVKS